MREQLVRYLLGELDAAEQSQLERQLRSSPELRRELAHLQSCFSDGSQADDSQPEPPRGLAERTTERVADAAEGGDEAFGSKSLDFSAGRPGAYASEPDPPAGLLGWSLADIAVAGGVFLAVSMLLAPALRNSQDASRRNSCANNQREIYFVIAPYADRHDGLLPTVNPDEFAGMFFVRLIGEDNISQEDASRILVCSGSPLRELIRRGEDQIVIPREIQVHAVRRDSLADLFRTSTGSYAVPLPSIKNNRYICRRLFDTEEFPIFADAPNFRATGVETPNHFGGVLVLYSRGNVRFQTTAVDHRWRDPIYVNVLGRPEAGRGEHDSVLVSGDRTPGVELIGNPD